MLLCHITDLHISEKDHLSVIYDSIWLFLASLKFKAPLKREIISVLAPRATKIYLKLKGTLKKATCVRKLRGNGKYWQRGHFFFVT